MKLRQTVRQFGKIYRCVKSSVIETKDWIKEVSQNSDPDDLEN